MVATPMTADVELDRVADLLGGRTSFDDPFSTVLEAHMAIQEGFPSKSLAAFIKALPSLGREDVIGKVVGVSKRTSQRRAKAGHTDRLSREQSGRLYRTAEIVAKAVEVLGSTQAAERFLEEPALALDNMAPIDLLSTPAGAELVDRHLTRIDFGVYT